MNHVDHILRILMCIPTHLFVLFACVLSLTFASDRVLSVPTATAVHLISSNHVCRTASYCSRIALIRARTKTDEYRPRHSKACVPRACIRHGLHVDAGRQEPIAGALPSRRKVALDEGARGGASEG